MRTLALICQGRRRDRKGIAKNSARQAEMLLGLFFLAGFAVLLARLLQLGSIPGELPSLAAATSPPMLARSRPDILDRHGRILATDIRIYWLSANPRQIANADDAAEKIVSLLPDLDQAALVRKFRDKSSRFEWVKRGLTPKQAEAVHRLGLPALTIFTTNQRFYPAGNEAAHILGVTNVDNEGLSGVERYIDKTALHETPLAAGGRPAVRLSLDLGVQHALAEELAQALRQYGAAAGLAIVIDVRNGEVLGSVSLPDFDPNRRGQAGEQNRQNRVVADLYELGSVFKTFTIAMALDRGVAGRLEVFDTRPFFLGHFMLRDVHAKREPLSVEEIFIRSSNTGAARIALAAGIPLQKSFLESLGLFARLETEAGTSPKPSFPQVWRTANQATIAYGHGIAVPPLLFASAMAAIVNGGVKISPTFLISGNDGAPAGERVITPETSAVMRELMRLVVERGTGKRAGVPGLDIGGKTGTALKLRDGRYSSEVMNTFVAAVPIGDPKYLIMVTLDDPKPEQPGVPNEAAYNAVPAARAIIKRIAPMLGILPAARFDEAGATSYERTGSNKAQITYFRTGFNETGGVDRGYSAFGESGRSSPFGYFGDNRR